MNEPSVIIRREGSLGRLHFNRPKALNSLTLDMVRLLDRTLTEFGADDCIACVLITGAGEKELCAGGDIIALYESAKVRDGAATQFWAEKYRPNARISNYTKPYVVFMDAITMGGDVGVSAHGRHRIVTDRTELAMPETGIGLFPDVGGTWLLGHCAPGEIGTYIGLTCTICGAAEAIFAGFADFYMKADQLDSLVSALATLPASADGPEIERAIRALSEMPPTSAFEQVKVDIDEAFVPDVVEEIIAVLHVQDTEFSRNALKSLREESPTSLKITLALLRAARTSGSLRDCLVREFAMTGHILNGADFYESVRAAVVDKGRTNGIRFSSPTPRRPI